MGMHHAASPERADEELPLSIIPGPLSAARAQRSLKASGPSPAELVNWSGNDNPRRWSPTRPIGTSPRQPQRSSTTRTSRPDGVVVTVGDAGTLVAAGRRRTEALRGRIAA